jgi:glycerophosphoryl diester phosphodiesterase
VVHANGVKVWGDSYGFNEDGSRVTPFSGKVGSTLMEEARDRGKAIAVINSGRSSEPGSGAFLAEVADRGNHNEIFRQLVLESGAQIIMGGGERWLLPVGVAGRFGGSLNQTGARTDGLNLIQEAIQRGYRVIYTSEDLATVRAGEKILGVFAWEDTYNSRTEEDLAARGLQPYGQPGNPNPPTVAEMLQATLTAVSSAPNGFFIALEEEGTDNLPNANNAAGAIQAALRADAAIGVAMDFIRNTNPNTLLLTAADSEAGGLQVFQPTPFAPGYPSTPLTTPPTLGVNPTNVSPNPNQNPLDGVNGRLAPWTAFPAQPSLDGPMGNFGVGWVGTPDFPGSIVAKAYGMNADLLPSTLDNTEIYKIMYQTLFGTLGDPDAINGIEGNDDLCGTRDGETFIAGGGDDFIEARGGDDRIFVGVGNSTIKAGAGDDVVSTDDGNHTIEGGSGNDRISTGRGNSIIRAGTGDDVINTSLGGNNTIYGGVGDDVIAAGSGDDLIYGGEGNDIITAGSGTNTIYGGDGDDLISSGSGNDVIYVGKGDNVVSSGTGEDTLYLGGELDRFILTAGSGSVAVYGFDASDRISLGSGLSFTSLSITQNGRDTLITSVSGTTSDLLARLVSVRSSTITSTIFA